jgi:hypothetical protein
MKKVLKILIIIYGVGGPGFGFRQEADILPPDPYAIGTGKRFSRG